MVDSTGTIETLANVAVDGKFAFMTAARKRSSNFHGSAPRKQATTRNWYRIWKNDWNEANFLAIDIQSGHRS